MYRNRFFSEWHQKTPQIDPQPMKMSRFFPESPQISKLELCEDLEDLFLDEPLNQTERAQAMSEINSKIGTCLSINNFNQITNEKSINSFEAEICQKNNYPNQIQNNQLDVNILEEDDYLKEYDEISIMGVMGDSIENETQIDKNISFETRKTDKQWTGKRDFKSFLEGKCQQNITKIPNEDDYEKLIEEEVEHNKKLLNDMFFWKQKEVVNKTRGRCQSFHAFGGRQIFKFMNKHKK